MCHEYSLFTPPQTNLILTFKYTKSGSAPRNRLRHVDLDRLAEDGPERQWQGCDSALGAPAPGVLPPLPCFALWAPG
jgi:hypothetical protein